MGDARSLFRVAVGADLAFWTAWVEAVARGHNDHGVQLRRFGRVTALLSHGAPVPFFNRVLGLTPGDLGILDEVLAFYRERQTPLRLDVAARSRSRVLRDQLTAHALSVREEQSSLCGRVAEMTIGDDSGISIREVEVSDATGFATLYDGAYGMAGGRLLARFRRDTIEARFGAPGWRFYVAFLDNRPAAGAIMFVDGQTATLAGGATLAEARGRGCQSALVRRRVMDAAESGCTYVVSRCRRGSASHRNLARAGLKEVCKKQVWEGCEEIWAGASPAPASVITAA